MHQFHHAEINFNDGATRKFYFISTSVILAVFWILSFIVYSQNYETGVAFLIFTGVFTSFFVISTIVIYCLNRNEGPLLPITNRRDVNDIIHEINDIE